MPRAATERMMSGIVTTCCVVLVALAVRRELLDRGDVVANPRQTAARLLPSFDSLIDAGTLLGSSDRGIRLVVFSDFECPACQRFSETLHDVATRFEGRLAVYIVHYPLQQHRFAYRAAQASECAADQDRFQAFHDLLYSLQDSIGILSWSVLARRAQIPDSARFHVCTSERSSLRVDAAGTLVQRHGIERTPSIVMEGWLLPRTPGSAELEEYLLAFEQGRVPNALREISQKD